MATTTTTISVKSEGPNAAQAIIGVINQLIYTPGGISSVKVDPEKSIAIVTITANDTLETEGPF